MKANLFKIECLTNLHVGSGDVNFNIIDKEIEKDPATGYPTINASGVKGALRDVYKGEKKENIFGAEGTKVKGNPGTYKFIDAKFLSRPLRVGGNSDFSYISVTTIDAINDFLELTSAFGCNNFGIDSVNFNFNEKDFLVSNNSITNIEGSGKIGELNNDVTLSNLKKILGDNFAIAKDINNYSLPVIARNKLDNGKSENLWYEEFVPHHSVFSMIVFTPDAEKFDTDLENLLNGVVQFGGNASVGYGYCRISLF